jgi:hypothetical protein
MTEQIDYYQLTQGYQFPEAGYRLTPELVAAYLDAVEDVTNYGDDDHGQPRAVPPLAVTALAMASLSKSVDMPDGSIHTQQEASFCAPVHVGDEITCRSWVSSKRERGRFNLMTVDLSVVNAAGVEILNGKTSFILPERSDA